MNSLLLKIALLLCVASLPFGHSDLVVNDSRHVESYRQYRNESRLVCVTRSKSRCVRWLFHEECRDIYYCEHQLRYDVQYSTIFRCQSGWKTYPDCDIPICSKCTAGTRCTAPNNCTEYSREPSPGPPYPSRTSRGQLITVLKPRPRKTARMNNKELQIITRRIWATDLNGVEAKYVEYNTKDGSKKFFGKVDETAFINKPTFATMIALFGNNEAFTGTKVTRDQDLLAKENAFLDAILTTRPIELAHKWLFDNALTSSETLSSFKDELRQYWFTRYSRQPGGPRDSSGFRHTFVGEFDGVEFKGLHNWVRMYFEEKVGKLIYTGRDGGCTAPSTVTGPSVESVKFLWRPTKESQTYYKDSSVFIRTSPEVQIALSTVCLLARAGEDCHIDLDGQPLNLKTIVWTVAKKTTIRTSFPICP
jgi:poly(U)-specific endoribonuclease